MTRLGILIAAVIYPFIVLTAFGLALSGCGAISCLQNSNACGLN